MKHAKTITNALPKNSEISLAIDHLSEKIELQSKVINATHKSLEAGQNYLAALKEQLSASINQAVIARELDFLIAGKKPEPRAEAVDKVMASAHSRRKERYERAEFAAAEKALKDIPELALDMQK